MLRDVFRIPDDLRRDSWGRWAWWIQMISMATTAAGLIVVILSAGDGLRQMLLALPVAGLAVAWSWLSIVAADRIGAHAWAGVLFSSVDLVLLLALISIDDVFSLGIFFVYWRMFTCLRIPWSIVMSGIITVSIYKVYDGFSPDMLSMSQIGIIVFSLLGSTAIALFIGSIISESIQRRALLIQLEASREQIAVQEREAGIAAERQRLAGEVHDTLAQDFASIVMHLEAAGAHAELPLAIVTHLDAAKEVARSGLAESRRIVRALRPEMLQGRSLPAALDALCVRWSRESGIPCRFVLAGEEAPLPREVDVTLYRGLQEALTNVRKHAKATAVVATLSYLGDEVILDVRDNGIGFDAIHLDVRPPGESLGLVTMRERAAALSGTATIESGPGRGTTVTMQIPLSPGVRGEE